MDVWSQNCKGMAAFLPNATPLHLEVFCMENRVCASFIFYLSTLKKLSRDHPPFVAKQYLLESQQVRFKCNFSLWI